MRSDRCRIRSDGLNTFVLFLPHNKCLRGSNETVCVKLPAQGTHRAGLLSVNFLFLGKNSLHELLLYYFLLITKEFNLPQHMKIHERD